jgi:PEP-CTERM motif
MKKISDERCPVVASCDYRSLLLIVKVASTAPEITKITDFWRLERLKTMKLNFISKQKATLMQHSKWIGTLLALATGFVLGNSALAQDYVTGTPTLSNVFPNNAGPDALYAGWANPPTVFTTGPSGLEVYGYGYGSLFYSTSNSPVSINQNDTEAVLVMTVNNLANAQNNAWMGISFLINDNSGAYTLGGYAGMYGFFDTGNGLGAASWSGNTVTETVQLNGALLTAIQAGGDQIQGFNLQMDPAVYPGGFYDVTFNSLSLQAVPEPASLALVGAGLMGLAVLRRRK